MAALIRKTIDTAGTAPAYVPASAGGDSVDATEHTMLHVKNGSAAPVTVTLVVPGQRYGQANPDIPVTVPAAGGRFIRVPKDIENPATSKVDITYSAVATVTVAALDLG